MIAYLRIQRLNSNQERRQVMPAEKYDISNTRNFAKILDIKLSRRQISWIVLISGSNYVKIDRFNTDRFKQTTKIPYIQKSW